MWSSTRSLHVTGPALARAKRLVADDLPLQRLAPKDASARKLAFTNILAVTLRPPIVPTHKNFDVNPNHPLWAFFPGGSKCTSPVRSEDEIDRESRMWTHTELRRKSFEELHVLWYKVLLDRNVLAREVRYAQAIKHSKVLSHMEADKKLMTTHKRIRQVLLERQTAYERVQTMTSKQQHYLRGFARRYVSADEHSPLDAQLLRLMHAFFGIKTEALMTPEPPAVDEKFVAGVEYVARVKLQRHLAQNRDSGFEEPLNGIMEEAPFLLQSAADAVAEVERMRAENVSRFIYKNETFAYLANKFTAPPPPEEE